MTDITIREATADDLPFMVNLIEIDSVYGSIEDTENPKGPSYLAALAAIDADPNQLQLVAELDGERVGMFQLTFTPGIARKGAWRCTIEGVHVSPEHRNKKIGEKMMLWAIDTARARGCTNVQLTSNNDRDDAHRFYTRLGFKGTHTGFKLSI